MFSLIEQEVGRLRMLGGWKNKVVEEEIKWSKKMLSGWRNKLVEEEVS